MVFEFGVFVPDAAQIAAHGLWAQVYVDRETRRPVPIPDAVRTHLEGAVAGAASRERRLSAAGARHAPGRRPAACAPGAAPAPTPTAPGPGSPRGATDVHAVVAVTGRAVVAGARPASPTPTSTPGASTAGAHAHDPRVMTRLAGEDGWVDVLDAVLLADGTGDRRAAGCVARPDLRDHPRVRHALPIRGDVRVLGLDG